MNTHPIDPRKLFFFYLHDRSANKTVYRFGGGASLVSMFHKETGTELLMRRVEEGGDAKRWRGYIQHGLGSIHATDIIVSGETEEEAAQNYCEERFPTLAGERLGGPGEKSIFLCEGERGLLWMLDTVKLCALFNRYHPKHPPSFFCTETLLNWMSYGELSQEDYMAILRDVAASYPLVICMNTRVQLALQITQIRTQQRGAHYDGCQMQ